MSQGFLMTARRYKGSEVLETEHLHFEGTFEALKNRLAKRYSLTPKRGRNTYTSATGLTKRYTVFMLNEQEEAVWCVEVHEGTPEWGRKYSKIKKDISIIEI